MGAGDSSTAKMARSATARCTAVQANDENKGKSQQEPQAIAGAINKNLLSLCLEDSELVRLVLDDQSFVFIDGTWCADVTSRDYRKLSRQNQLLAAENNLLRVKLDILLHLVSKVKKSDAAKNVSKKILTHRKNSVKLSKLGTGFSTPIDDENFFQPNTEPTISDALLESDKMEGILFAIGDPLLDIIAEVPLSLLEKYSLVPDHGYLMTDKLRELCRELESGSYQLSRVPGGSELNCFKMVQRLIGVPKTTSYIGCIGRDSNGEILKAAVANSGINAFFQYTDDAPTGVCYVCLTDVQRTLVTNVGAALTNIGSFLDDPEMWSYVQKAKYFYLEAYSMSCRYEETLKIANYAFETNKLFAMNLSSAYLCRQFTDEITGLLPYVDLLFGSELEALAFAEARQLDTKSIEEIALSLARSRKASGRRGRLVVLTRGKHPVISVHNGCLRQFPVVPINTLHIQDTVGAGDTFVGGYLAALIKGEVHEECMKSALNAAHYTIRQRGCEIKVKKTDA